jgi:hypothetical protein
MDKALQHTATPENRAADKIDWRRKISDNVAFGLLAYTGLHIFMTMTMLKNGHGSMLPYLALVLLVAAVIPACRWFEMRWEDLTAHDLGDPARAPQFRREVTLLWVAAIGLPMALTFGFKAIAALF